MKLLIRPSIVLGVVAGLGFGIILMIPFIQSFACLTYVFIGAGIVFFLKRNALIGILSIQEGAIIGAISGFVATIASSIFVVPYIILVFKLGSSLFGSLGQAGTSLLFFIPLAVFFIALLNALFNAFTALIVAYIYEKLEGNREKDGFIIDQE